MLTDNQIIKILYPRSWDYLCGANIVQVIANARVLEAAATTPLLERIAELERLRAEDLSHFLDMAAAIETLGIKLADANEIIEQRNKMLSAQHAQLAQRVPDERAAFEIWFAPYWEGRQSDLAPWAGWQARAALTAAPAAPEPPTAT